MTLFVDFVCRASPSLACKAHGQREARLNDARTIYLLDSAPDKKQRVYSNQDGAVSVSVARETSGAGTVLVEFFMP